MDTWCPWSNTMLLHKISQYYDVSNFLLPTPTFCLLLMWCPLSYFVASRCPHNFQCWSEFLSDYIALLANFIFTMLHLISHVFRGGPMCCGLKEKLPVTQSFQTSLPMFFETWKNNSLPVRLDRNRLLAAWILCGMCFSLAGSSLTGSSVKIFHLILLNGSLAQGH